MQQQERLAEAGEREDRGERYDEPVAALKPPHLVFVDGEASRCLGVRDLRLLHGEEEDSDRGDRREYGDPEHQPVVVSARGHECKPSAGPTNAPTVSRDW